MRRITAALGVVGLALGFGGCGGGQQAAAAAAAAAASASARGDRAMVEFTRCMRAHGIEMADPAPRPGHAGLSIDLPEQGPATESAYKVCGQLLTPVITNKLSHAPTATASERLGLIHYAVCMRSHAVPMLDPDAQGSLDLGDVPGISSGVGRYTPQFRAADRDCRRLLPPAIHDDGSGP